MKKVWMYLCITIAVFILAGCGGSSTNGSTTYSVSGAINGVTTQVKVTLVSSAVNSAGNPTFASNVDSDISGNYSFVGVPNGEYMVTPVSASYAFMPPSTLIKVAGADYPRVNFSAVQKASPPAGNPQAGGITITNNNTGVILNLADEYVDPATGITSPGGKIVTSGNLHEWRNVLNDVFQVNYKDNATWIGLAVLYTHNGTTEIMQCGLSGLPPMGIFPCTDMGITFDHLAGKVTFNATTMRELHMPGGLLATSPLTENGILTFAPF